MPLIPAALVPFLLTLGQVAGVAPSALNPISGGGFVASAPCTGRWTTTRDTSNAQAGPFDSHVFRCESGDEVYLLAWVQYDRLRPDAEPELIANRDNLVKALGATLLNSTNMTILGLPGLEFTANWGGTRLVTSRAVMLGFRPYMLAVVTPLNQNRAANIGRFFNSLRLAP